MASLITGPKVDDFNPVPGPSKMHSGENLQSKENDSNQVSFELGASDRDTDSEPEKEEKTCDKNENVQPSKKQKTDAKEEGILSQITNKTSFLNTKPQSDETKGNNFNFSNCQVSIVYNIKKD